LVKKATVGYAPGPNGSLIQFGSRQGRQSGHCRRLPVVNNALSFSYKDCVIEFFITRASPWPGRVPRCTYIRLRIHALPKS
jgi:hypothetical protein